MGTRRAALRIQDSSSNYFKNISSALADFSVTLSSPARCAELVVKHRHPDGYQCSRCGGADYLFCRSRYFLRCKNGRCRRQESLTAGTVLHGSRVPLEKWLCFLFLLSQAHLDLGLMELQAQLKVGSYHSIQAMMVKVHEALPSHRRLRPDSTLDAYRGIVQDLSAYPSTKRRFDYLLRSVLSRPTL